jgi:predicted O-methyltransferase YrrM
MESTTALTATECGQIKEIIRFCNPMHTEHALSTIYLAGKSMRGAGLVVEIGTGHGAGTMALSLGLRVNNPNFRLITFERIEKGSRRKYGDFDTNVRIIRDNIARFGMEDHVIPHFVGVEDGAAEVPEGEISALMIDADGRIDRDFILFYPRIREGGTVIIDDTTGGLQVVAKPLTFMRSSLARGKHRTTEVLVSEFTERGLIRRVDGSGQLVIFEKPAGAPPAVDLQWVVDAYRRMLPSPMTFGGLIVFTLPRVPRSVIEALRRLKGTKKADSSP